MRIEIRPLHESLQDKSLHLRISTPDGNCYNFRVPETAYGERGECSFIYPYESMRALHELLDKFINKQQYSPPQENGLLCRDITTRD